MGEGGEEAVLVWREGQVLCQEGEHAPADQPQALEGLEHTLETNLLTR